MYKYLEYPCKVLISNSQNTWLRKDECYGKGIFYEYTIDKYYNQKQMEKI